MLTRFSLMENSGNHDPLTGNLMSEGFKTLILDIETYPQLQWAWSHYEGNALRVAQYAQVAVVAYKWHGERRTHTISQWHDPKYKPGVCDDGWILTNIYDTIVSADFVIAHYGLGFDRPMLETRMAIHDLGPLRPRNMIDTKKELSKILRVPANSLSLGNLAEQFGLGHKLETNLSLWFDCMEGVPRAHRKMDRYAKHDVKLLEKLYDKFGPYMRKVPNAGHFALGEDACTWCGSYDLERRGFVYTNASKFQQYKCRDCGRWSRSATREPQKVAEGTNVSLR